MESICKTPCRSVTIALPKRFTRKVSVVPNYLTNLSVKKDRFRIFVS